MSLSHKIATIDLTTGYIRDSVGWPAFVGLWRLPGSGGHVPTFFRGGQVTDKKNWKLCLTRQVTKITTTKQYWWLRMITRQ